MVDQDWLRNLAGASFVTAPSEKHAAKTGSWVHADPLAVRRLAESRVLNATTILLDLANDYAAAFNTISAGKRKFKVFTIQGRSLTGDTGDGLLLLLSNCQIQLVATRPGYNLEATLLMTQAFARERRPLHRFEPQIDPFGSVTWRMDGSFIMTDELIIKKLFEDITRAADATGEGPR